MNRNISIAVVSLLAASSAFASLPLTAGPGYSAGNGYFRASFPSRGNAAITHTGEALMNAEIAIPNTNDGGIRPFRLDPTGPLHLPGTWTQPGGYGAGSAASINSSLDAVGNAFKYVGNTAYGSRALRWDAQGNVTVLDDLQTTAEGNASSFAVHLNESGVAVGYSTVFAANGNARGSRPVFWMPGGTAAQPLPSLADMDSGYNNSQATAINNSGTIVGFSGVYVANQYLGTRVLRWDANGSMTVLGHLGGGVNGANTAKPSDINDAGLIAGTSEKYNPDTFVFLGNRPVRYAPGSTTAVELGVLGSSASGRNDASLYDVGETGLIVGMSYKYDAARQQRGTRAVYWNGSGSTVVTELPGLGTDANGNTSGSAYTVNADNVIAGTVTKYVNGNSQGRRAVLWFHEQGDALLDLNTFLPGGSKWKLQSANSISDTGFVAGAGWFDPDLGGPINGFERGFLMLVPQAGTYGRGDANFDTHVNFDDLLLLAQNYGESNPSQSIHVGDLNLDGSVNFDDLLALVQHYEGTASLGDANVGTAFAQDWALALTLVPEPATVIGVLCCVRRSRRSV